MWLDKTYRMETPYDAPATAPIHSLFFYSICHQLGESVVPMEALNPPVPVSSDKNMAVDLPDLPTRSHNYGAEAFKNIVFGSVSYFSLP
jgi:hypothetical protein